MSVPTPEQRAAAMDEFRAGVTACLRSWSALKTAVESGWGGGPQSYQKAEDLRDSIFQYMDGSSFPPKQLQDVMDLEDSLAIYLEEEFSVTLEDGSEKQVAEAIWQLYHQCCFQGDFSLSRHLVSVAQQAAILAQQYPVQIQSPEQDDDDDEDDDAMDTSDDNAPPQNAMMQNDANIQLVPVAEPTAVTAAEYASQTLFGPQQKPKVYNNAPVRQLGESAPATEPVVEVDDDGFAAVTPKKGKKSRKPL